MKNILKFILLIFAFSAESQAASLTFTNGAGDYQWDNVLNWSSGTLPTISDSVVINTRDTSLNWTNGENLIIGQNIEVDSFTFHGNGSWSTGFSNSIQGGATITANSVFLSQKDTTCAIDASFIVNGKLTVSNGGDISANKITAQSITVESGVVFAHKKISTLDNPSIVSSGALTVNSGAHFKAAGKSTGSYYAKFAGIEGAGKIIAENNEANVSSGYIILTGAGVYDFTGTASHKKTQWNDTTNKSIHIIKQGGGTQNFTNTTLVEFSSVTVENGIFQMSGDAGNLIIRGGKFGVYNAGTTGRTVSASSLIWEGGDVGMNLLSATEFDKIVISGALSKGADFAHRFDFNVSDALKQAVLESAGAGVKLSNIVTFESTDMSKDDITFADNDFQYIIDFTANGIDLTINAIPEPADFAVLFGIIAMFYILKLRKNI